MTKTFKRIFAILLAITILFAVSVTALAAEPPYTITINNNSSAVSMNGITYSAYKIFDVTLSGDDAQGVPQNYAYTISDEFKDFTYTVGENSYSGKALIDYVARLSNNSDALNDFAAAVRTYIINNTISASATVAATDASTAIISVNDLGYYLVTATAKPTDVSTADETVTAFCALNTTNYNAEVNLKADVPTITKGVKEDDDINYAAYADGEINEKFNFLLTATIPSYASYYNSYTYIIHDTMDSSLTLDKDSIKLYSDLNAKTPIDAANYTISADSNEDGCTFEIAFNSAYFTAENEGKTIYVCYDATLNTDTKIYTESNNNAVHIEYSNDAYDESITTNTPDKTVKVYSYSFNLFKYYLDGETKTGLADAHFKLYRDEACTQEISLIKNTDGTYRLAQADETAVEIISTTERVTIKGLDSGDYYLKETKAPNGYNLNPDAVKITITATAKADTTDIESVSLKQDGADATEISIQNNSGTLLPLTGGIGTVMFYVVGGVLVVGVVIILITRMRVSRKKNSN